MCAIETYAVFIGSMRVSQRFGLLSFGQKTLYTSYAQAYGVGGVQALLNVRVFSIQVTKSTLLFLSCFCREGLSDWSCVEQDLLSATGARGSTFGVSASTKHVSSRFATSAPSLQADREQAQELPCEWFLSPPFMSGLALGTLVVVVVYVRLDWSSQT